MWPPSGDVGLFIAVISGNLLAPVWGVHRGDDTHVPWLPYNIHDKGNLQEVNYCHLFSDTLGNSCHNC